MWGCCFRVPRDDRFFLENGAQLLEELISVCDGKSNPIKNFSLKEIEKMTSNFASNQRLRTSSRFYKGTLDDDYFVAVKKCYLEDYSTLKKEYIHDIAITSHLNHKNVVKLLGCCLESEFLVSVYEFCANGALCDHIGILPWQSRLRIATEIADAVTYLHTATSNRIVHRDIKPNSILLDQNYVAKLSDFSLSVSIPMGETEVLLDEIKGTPSYIAPEYITTGHVTEKIDVYSFGVVLLELLTGQRILELTGQRILDFTGQRILDLHYKSVVKDFMLFDYVRSLMEDNRLSEIVAPTILNEGVIEKQLQAFVELAVRCIEKIAEDRPVMIEVAKELRRIKTFV